MGCPLSRDHHPEPIIATDPMETPLKQAASPPPSSSLSPTKVNYYEKGVANCTAATTTTTASTNDNKNGSIEVVNYKAKLSRKMCWSKDTPDPVFDLAGCNLKDVPNGVYINCKILLKTQLLLHDNRLESLHGGGQLSDLSTLTVLNLAHNRLRRLPDDIHTLMNLRLLDVSNNELKALPTTIMRLEWLERLNLASNRLVSVAALVGCRRLRLLNLSNNPRLIAPTPQELRIGCMTLEQVIYDNADTVFTCDDEEASRYHTNLCSSIQDNTNKQILESMAQDTRDLEEYQRQQDEKRRNLLQQLQCEQVEVDERMASIQKEKDSKRWHLIEEMAQEEDLYKKLITDLLCLKDGPDPELLERERIEQEHLLDKFFEQQNDLRRQDVLSQMTTFLDQELDMIRQYQSARDTVSRQILEQVSTMNDDLAAMMQESDSSRGTILNQIAQNEELQKSAVGALIAKNDARSWGLMEQIKILEQELGKVTQKELARKQLQMDEQINELAARRTDIMFILMDLMQQQQQRKKELLSTLEMMERNRDIDSDYWLMQYQRVLDNMPAEQWLQVLTIDTRLGHMFLLYGVIHCLPFLYKVWQTVQTDLNSVSEELLQEAGIRNEADRYNILRAIEDYLMASAGQQGAGSSTAPEESVADDSDEEEGEALSIGSECVICLDRASQMLFIPCGHLCCCFNCQTSLVECPMCRATIESRIKIIQN